MVEIEQEEMLQRLMEEGAREKTVDIAVARRFKKRGMSWHRKCANPLLKLRLLKLNGEKDIYWQERRKEVARYAP